MAEQVERFSIEAIGDAGRPFSNPTGAWVRFAAYQSLFSELLRERDVRQHNQEQRHRAETERDSLRSQLEAEIERTKTAYEQIEWPEEAEWAVELANRLQAILDSEGQR